MTSRRQFVFASLSGAFASWPAAAQTRPVTIGILGPRAQSFFVPVIRQRLAELGYGEGPSVRIENRHADGAIERFPRLAGELAGLRCDLIFAVGPEHAPRALLEARVAAPIVFLAVDYDPLEKKIVERLARPGGNITGLYSLSAEVTLKRLEIAQETVPSAKRFLILSDAYTRDQLTSVRKAAQQRGMELSVVEFIQSPHDYAQAFANGRQQGVDAVLVLTSPVLADHRNTIAELALRHRLPSFGFVSPEGYFLVSYSANGKKMSDRVAEIGVQILRGAKAGEIPVQQATELDLVVNLKTAKQLGLRIPYSVLARATKVIE